MSDTKSTNSIYAPVPMKWVGPFKISGEVLNEEVEIPLATYETTLWPSVARGAHVSLLSADGIQVTIVDERMTRSVILESPSASRSLALVKELAENIHDLQQVVQTTSRFAKLININHQIVGNLLFLRFEFLTGDASGHNMTTLASDHLLNHILCKNSDMLYGSISGNFCTDKKTSAVNGILGRGKNTIAEILIPKDVVERRLKTTAEKIEKLNIQKNLIGGSVSGSLRTANAHYANMLLAFYLATGQDAANIVEGSQGFTHAENRDGDLYFSCTVPNLIVGTVGHGKDLSVVTDNLGRLGCLEERNTGENSRRLAAICAAAILAGELSLMAAQTNPGELMAAHVKFERESK